MNPKALFRFAALLCLLLAGVAAARAGEAEVTLLHFSGEPIGSEYPLARGLAADAADLLASDQTLGFPDAAATTLQQGRLVRAFAEALALAENSDPVLVARSHARCALILARLGAVNFAAEHANEALAQSAVRGEVMLARAWMLWHAGNLAEADTNAARSTGAPAWALDEFRAHRAKFAPALAKFQAAPEPGDPCSTEFLAYTDLALAARVFYLADGLCFRATNNLQQQFSHEPNFPPANLQRARRAQRDLIRTILGDIAREPGSNRLAAVVLATAREVCATPATKADWETYFQLVADIRTAQQGFDLGYYDFHGDLARAEKEAALDPAWRERLKPLLADPRQRYASRLLQTIARLEAHPAHALLEEPADTAFTPAQLDQLEKFLDLARTEETALARLRDAVPFDARPLYNHAEYLCRVAHAHLRFALGHSEPEVAREQLAVLRDYGEVTRFLPLDAYEKQIVAAERGPFLAAYAQLLRFPPEHVPEKLLQELLAAAGDISAQLAARHGEDYALKIDLPADDVALVQRLYHVRLAVALGTGRVFAAERALAALQTWCDPKKHSAFEPLPGLVTAVTDLPAQAETFTTAEQQIWNVLKDGRSDPAFPAQLRALIADQPDRFAPHILLPLAHWRLCQDDLAAAAIASTKEILRVNRASRAHLDALAENNDPVRVVRGLVAALAKTSAAERPAQAAATLKAIDGLVRHLSQVFCAGQTIDLKKLPPDARRAYAFCVAGTIHARLAQNRLRDAVRLVAPLGALNLPDAFAFARPAVENFPFTHDLPDETTRATWRRLIDPQPLATAELDPLFAPMRAAIKAGSLSAEFSALLFQYRNNQLDNARQSLAQLRATAGLNRAFAAQLALVDALLRQRAGGTILIFDESADSLTARHNRLAEQHTYLRSVNADAIYDAYSTDTYNPARREIEALEREIQELSDAVDRQRAKEKGLLQKQQTDRATAERETYASLRRLMAL